MANNLQVKRFLRTGNTNPRNFQDLMEQAGNLLDAAYSHDIVGEVVFEATDGKYYVGTVEFCIDEINPEYLQDILTEDAVEEGNVQSLCQPDVHHNEVDVIFWNNHSDTRVSIQCSEWLESLSRDELRCLLTGGEGAAKIRESCYHYYLSRLTDVQSFDDLLYCDGCECPIITINMDQLRRWSSLKRPQLWTEVVA